MSLTDRALGAIIGSATADAAGLNVDDLRKRIYNFFGPRSEYDTPVNDPYRDRSELQGHSEKSPFHTAGSTAGLRSADRCGQTPWQPAVQSLGEDAGGCEIHSWDSRPNTVNPRLILYDVWRI